MAVGARVTRWGGVMIYQIVYRCVATQDFWPDDLFALVETARRKNAQRSVTGLLLFHEGVFLQLLEGPQRETEGVFEFVKLDPRHKDVEVLLAAEAPERQFPGVDDGLRTARGGLEYAAGLVDDSRGRDKLWRDDEKTVGGEGAVAQLPAEGSGARKWKVESSRNGCEAAAGLSK